jgi:hypothetical protein
LASINAGVTYGVRIVPTAKIASAMNQAMFPCTRACTRAQNHRMATRIAHGT